MSQSVSRQLAAARRIADPIERARTLQTQVMPALADLENAVLNERAVACADANDAGMGYRRIALELGVSTPRAQQLVAEGRRVRRGENRWQPKPTPTT
jgi:hypothetical protein